MATRGFAPKLKANLGGDKTSRFFATFLPGLLHELP
jgi:hypothetical protein